MTVAAGDTGPDPKRAALDAWRHAATYEPLTAPHADLAFETVEELEAPPGLERRHVRDLRLGRLATLQRPRGPVASETFLREARLMVRLEHASIPPVYELGVGPDGRPYLLTKIQRGPSLADLIAEGEADLRRRIEILRRVASALAVAHRRQVLARGLRPETILVGRHGEVTLRDWATARDLTESAAEDQRALAELAAAGLIPTIAGGGAAVVPGVAGYLAPEVLRGEAADGRSDVFLLGLLLQELLDGEPAIAGESEADRVAATLGGERVRPALEGIERAPELRSLIAAATAPEPADRLAGAALFAEDLEAWLADRPLRCHRPGRLERAARVVRRHPARVLAALAGILALIPMIALGSLARRARAARIEAEMKGQDTVRRLTRKEQERSRRRRARQSLSLAEQRSFRLDEAAASIAALEAALELDPKTPSLRLGVARVYRNLGRVDRARAVLEALLAEDPDCEEAYLGLFRLECLESPHRRLPRPAELASRALERLAARRRPASPAARLAELHVRIAGAEGTARLEAIRAAEQELANEISRGGPVELRLQRARMLAALGRVGEAVEAHKEAARQNPTALDLRLHLIAAAIGNADFNTANRACTVTRGIYGRRPEVLRLALRLTATRNIRRLAARIRDDGRELLKVWPGDPEVTALVAEAAVYLGDGEPALRRLRSAVREGAPSVILVEALGHVLETLDRTDEAIIEVAPLVDRLESPRLALQQGERLVRMGRASQALELATRTIQRRPEDPDGHALRALAALVTGRRSEAAEATERALVLQPTHPRAHAVKAGLLDGRGDRSAVAKHLNLATIFDPGSPDFHRMRVQLTRSVKQPEQALKMAENGIRCARRGHARLEIRAAELCVNDLERPRAALAWLESLLDPARALPISQVLRANALALKANALRALDRPGEALPFAEQAFKLEPKTQMGSVLIKTCLEAGDPGPALKYARGLARVDIKNRHAPELLARVLLACDETAGAAQALQAADKIGPETFERLVLRRRLAARLGRPEAEARFARRLLDPTFKAERDKHIARGYDDQAARLALLRAPVSTSPAARLELASRLRERRPDDPATLQAYASILASQGRNAKRLAALLRARVMAHPGERVDSHRRLQAVRGAR